MVARVVIGFLAFVGLIVLLTLCAVGDGEAAEKHTRCDYPWRQSTKAKVATIRCWSEERGIDYHRVLAIARCESGQDLQDRYADDGYVGPFQQSVSYWPERARAHGAAGYPGWHVWAAAKASTAMMANGGWSHWACA